MEKIFLECDKIYYCDCLDFKRGLSSLPDKSNDLSITEPPFNVSLKASSKNLPSNRRRIKPKAIVYEGNILNYDIWCFNWSKELKKIGNMIIIYCSG